MRPASILALVLATLTGCALSHQREGAHGPPQIAGSASLAIDETFLYWADPGRHAVVRAPRGGGAVTVLASAEPALYAPVALTGRALFWADEGDGIDVWRVPLAGGPRSRVGDGSGGPIGVAADLEHVYYSRLNEDFDLMDVDLATGEARVLAAATPALGLVIDGDDLLGTSCRLDGLWRVSRETGARTSIATVYCPITIALHGDDVYFSDYAVPTNPGVGGAGIFRAPSAGGGVATRVTISDGIAFAVHRGFVYTARDGSLVQVGRDGSAIELAPATEVRGVAVDDDLVYFTEAAEDGTLELAWVPLP